MFDRQRRSTKRDHVSDRSKALVEKVCNCYVAELGVPQVVHNDLVEVPGLH